MIILVTGGSGFIGSNLCNELVKNKSNHIICLDNNFTGSLDNIKQLRNLDNFEFIRHDVCKEILLEVDQIYHLACPASPKDYQINGIKTIKTNILGTMNMLGLAKRTNARILLSSTSEVYGDPKVSPQKEDYWGNVNPIGIRSCYDEGKRLAETLMMEYHRNCDVDIRIVRIFNTYGPNLNKNDGRVVSNFINQAIENENITIYGDGQQTRSFCFIDDLVKGLIKMMNTDSNEDTLTPINLGNPNEITMVELAEKVIELTKSKSKLVFRELPKDDPLQRKPDIGKAIRLLEWEPLVNLFNGLQKTINYFTLKN
uniref:NAD-dependent epimerase/dehydratase domain-containing protein n=1 Tax=viral metagenome TaxID=1070528 RepID=A0A6C0J864_9ZZZZ